MDTELVKCIANGDRRTIYASDQGVRGDNTHSSQLCQQTSTFQAMAGNPYGESTRVRNRERRGFASGKEE